MTKTLATMLPFAVLLGLGCSSVVTVDRTEIEDVLYMPTDAGKPDTGMPDTGMPDTGMPDTGMPDTGVPDAGDAGGADAGDAAPSS